MPELTPNRYVLGLALAIPTALAGHAVSAQQASYTAFGSGSPTLSVAAPPKIGRTFTVQLTACASWDFPFIIWGTSNQSWGGVTLPLDLSTIFGSGSFYSPYAPAYSSSGLYSYYYYFGYQMTVVGSLFVSPDVLVPGRTATVSIPNSSTLLGVSFYNQAVCFRHGFGYYSPGRPASLDFGSAGHGVIGVNSSGPVHCYDFDEASGTIALDCAGTQNGTLLPGVTRTTGIRGPGAVQINGQRGQAVLIQGGAGQFGTSDFTFSYWLRTNGSGGLMNLMGNRDWPGCNASWISMRMLGSGHITMEAAGGATCQPFAILRSGASLNDDVPHHVAITRSGPTMILYVDGAMVDSNTTVGVTNISNSDPWKIGTYGGFGVQTGTVGVFDELQFFDRALSAQEIAGLAQ